jgi:hypothetical protein
MVLYVPGTEETDPKKQNMSLQQIGSAATTNATNTATNTANIATNTTNIATNTTNIATNTTNIGSNTTAISALQAGPLVAGAVASKSDQVTGTDVTKAVTPGHQQDHISAAKVIVSFGTTGTIVTNYNVTSVAHTGTGVYTVTFTVPFSSANYAAIVTCNTGFEWYFSSKLAGSIVVNTFSSSFVAADVAADLVCFGSQ